MPSLPSSSRRASLRSSGTSSYRCGCPSPQRLTPSPEAIDHVVAGQTTPWSISLPTGRPQAMQINVMEHGRRHGVSVADDDLFGVQESVEVRALLLDLVLDVHQLLRENAPDISNTACFLENSTFVRIYLTRSSGTSLLTYRGHR